MSQSKQGPGLARTLWNRLFGDRGERLAAKYVKRLGYRVVKRGYRITQGEIDLIAVEGQTVVFIEVKTRKDGVPSEAVTLEKQRRLSVTALHFLKKHKLLENPSRFDVISILWPESESEPRIDHFRNAFDAVGRGQMFR